MRRGAPEVDSPSVEPHLDRGPVERPVEADPANVGVESVVRLALSGVVTRYGRSRGPEARGSLRILSTGLARVERPGREPDVGEQSDKGAPVLALAAAADQDGQSVGHEASFAAALACKSAVDVDSRGLPVVGSGKLMPVVVQALRCLDPNLAAPVAEERDRVAVGIDPERVGLAGQLSGPGLGDDVLPGSGAALPDPGAHGGPTRGVQGRRREDGNAVVRIVEGHRRRGSVSGGDERDALETAGGDRRIVAHPAEPPDQERRSGRQRVPVPPPPRPCRRLGPGVTQ